VWPSTNLPRCVSCAGLGWQARWFRQQRGIARYNCADSLDRTNVGSFFGAVQVSLSWGQQGRDSQAAGELQDTIVYRAITGEHRTQQISKQDMGGRLLAQLADLQLQSSVSDGDMWHSEVASCM
jgi:hypothetical protein